MLNTELAAFTLLLSHSLLCLQLRKDPLEGLSGLAWPYLNLDCSALHDLKILWLGSVILKATEASLVEISL